MKNIKIFKLLQKKIKFFTENQNSSQSDLSYCSQKFKSAGLFNIFEDENYFIPKIKVLTTVSKIENKVLLKKPGLKLVDYDEDEDIKEYEID